MDTVLVAGLIYMIWYTVSSSVCQLVKYKFGAFDKIMHLMAFVFGAMWAVFFIWIVVR